MKFEDFNQDMDYNKSNGYSDGNNNHSNQYGYDNNNLNNDISNYINNNLNNDINKELNDREVEYGYDYSNPDMVSQTAPTEYSKSSDKESHQFDYSYNGNKQDQYLIHHNYYQNNNQNNNHNNNQNSSQQYSAEYNQEQKDDMGNKKPKKRNGFLRFMMFSLSAAMFGAIAGASFQAIQLLTGYEGVGNQTPSNIGYTIEDPENGLRNVELNETTVAPLETMADIILTDVSGVVEMVMPSIVAINASATVTNFDIFGRPLNRQVGGSGSGIIIGQNGSEILIVTNNHVIAGADQVEIIFVDDSKAMATVKGAEARSDLAVVAVNLSELSKETASAIKVATLGNSNGVKPGAMSIAIGNALGYGQSVTVGYISALNREVTVDGIKMTLLQTDAAINPGNSGGALLNTAGEVIGINSVKYASARVEGMGYAIPISDAIPIINELMNRETLVEAEQGFLGLNLETAQDVTESYAQRFNMPIGIYINDVVKGSPVEKAGLRRGSIIVGFNDKTIETKTDLINILSYTRAGEEIILVINILENGEWVEQQLPVTLGNRPKR